MEALGNSRLTKELDDNTVGIDPHKHTLSATVLDHRGGLLGTEHFKVSGDGHRAFEHWALSFGPVAIWGVEGAGGVGRHTATFLCLRGHDVRDVCLTGPTSEPGVGARENRTPSTPNASRARRSPTRAAAGVQARRRRHRSGRDR